MALYLLFVFISACLRYPIAQLQLSLSKEFDGDFAMYVPGVKKEYSVAYCSEMYYTHNRRVQVALWLTLPWLPFYWCMQAVYLLSYIIARLSNFFDYNKELKHNKQKYPHYFN